MSRQEIVQVLTIFVASPSDVAPERSRLADVIAELNRSWSQTLGVRLEMIGWETHVNPGFGTDPQDVINSQIPQDYDLFIGIMWHRFGTPTPRAGSGTEEEFTRAKARWDSDNPTVELMFYFKCEQVPIKQLDGKQLAKVQEFKGTLGEQGGLYWEFDSTEDFEKLLRTQLSRVVQRWHEKTKEKSRPVVMNDKQTTAMAAAPSETEEVGLLELGDDLQDNMQHATEALQRILDATNDIASKMSEHAKIVERMNSTGTNSPQEMKRVTSRAATDMSEYAERLKADRPIVASRMEAGLDSLTKAVSLFPDFATTSETYEVARSLLSSVEHMGNVLSETKGSTQGFLAAVTSIPRLTTELNKGKRLMKTELGNLVGMLESQEQVISQLEAAISNMLDDFIDEAEFVKI